MRNTHGYKNQELGSDQEMEIIKKNGTLENMSKAFPAG